MKALGSPNLPIQVLPHPIGQISDEAMTRISEEAFEEVVRALVGSRDEISAFYSGATDMKSKYTLE